MITLSQYLGFIFREVSRARLIADQEAVRTAQEYAKDPLMKYLPVPRFKIPQLELSVPVVISGVQYRNTLAFDLPLATWLGEVGAQIDGIFRSVAVAAGLKRGAEVRFGDTLFDRVRAVLTKAYPELADMPADAGLELLRATKGGFAQDLIVQVAQQSLKMAELTDAHQKYFPANEPVLKAASVLSNLVQSRIVVRASTLASLLVSPETNVVNKEGTAISVFQIKATLTEQGVSVQSVLNADGSTTPVVDLD